MASVTIEDIDELTLQRIYDRAMAKNRTLQAELGDILRHALSADDRAKSLRNLAEDLAALTPKDVKQTDSVELLREDRGR